MYWGQDFKQGDGVREVENQAEEALLREHQLYFASFLAYWRDLHFSDEKIEVENTCLKCMTSRLLHV